VNVTRPDEVQPLTECEEGFFHRRPSWTPDGRSLVFNRSPGGWTGQLFRVPASGGPPIQITQDPAGTVNLAAAVTPDGRFAVHVSDRGGAINLWRIPVDGGTPERITFGPGQDMSPALSPDGRRIVFSNEPVAANLVALDPADGTRTLLSEFRGSEAWAPSLSPDRSLIALSRKVAGRSWEIILVPAAGGEARTVVDGLADVFWVRFNAGDGSLVFHARTDAGGRVGAVRTDGTALRWLTPAEEAGAYPDVSPTGDLVFVRARDGTSEIVLRQPSGEERVLLAGATLPVFSPDGRSVGFARSRSYSGGVGFVGLDSGKVRWLTSTGTWPTWMPDGRLAYADIGPGGNQHAWTVPIDGGGPLRMGTARWVGGHQPFVVDRASGRLITIDDASGSAMLWLAEY
jgi:Tol biopolymer transport system component